VVLLLFGPEYEASVAVLRVIALSTPPFFLSFALISILEAIDQQKSCATGVLQALAVATPIAGLLVWRFGLEGAAAGYVIAHMLMAAMLLWRTRSALRTYSVGHAVGSLVAEPGVAHG
jgi:O-antigen/teichoic acid export membrane protein